MSDSGGEPAAQGTSPSPSTAGTYPSIAPSLGSWLDELWWESPERLEGVTQFRLWAGCAFAAAVASAGVVLLGVFQVVWSSPLVTFLLTSVGTLASAGCAVNATRVRVQARAKFVKRSSAETIPPSSQPSATGAGREELRELIKVNREDMGRYQTLTQNQATTSYRWSLAALGAGLAVLIGGIVVVISATGTADKAAVAGLTGISGALASYVARTYLRIYERTLQQLNFYFQQPLVTSYLLAAERVTHEVDSPPDKHKIRVKIIEQALDAAAQPAEPTTAARSKGAERRARRMSEPDG